MMRQLIIIICSIFPLVALAQMRIIGTITDKNGEPLAGAIVQLRNSDTNKLIRFGKTNSKGAFSIEVVAKSYLEVSMLGFSKQRIDNPTTEKPLHIVLQEEIVALQEVTIKADKVREYGDTLTYNVGTYADQNDRNIGDVLAKMPGFEVNKQNGQIMYEGKPISKFYIEGLDMMGDKYGVATNSLPQVDVGSVQVMRNHQPIRVLEDFTYTDEAAVNIRMKEGAKSRWVTSFHGGAGISHHTGLWKLEGFGLRLKSDFQTMLTYKTNNTGQDISKETTSLFDFDNFASRGDYISLAPPTTPSLKENRTLFNRSHAVTLNTMKRLNESSQINVQLIYNNSRKVAEGERRTEYFKTGGNLVTDNRKDYLQKDNELYALVKYEHNSNRQYLKNSLSSDFTWSRQWLSESGINNHRQYARKPEYDIKDNLYIIRKFGNNLVSFYSNNRIVSRPQSLVVDSLFQRVSQQQYSTDTYVMGGTKLDKFSLSFKGGVNAALYRLESDVTGLSDSLGLLSGESRFTFARFYIEPKLTYKTRDINIELTPTTEYLYEKYGEDKGHRQLLFSPDINIRWYVTSRLRLSFGGYSSVESSDPGRFYRTLILQDFQYINQGWRGYRHNHTQSVRGGIAYNDALKSLHSILSVSRTFTTLPYTSTRKFVGNYIILSATEQETKYDSWQASLIASKGINLWNGVVNLRALYLNSNSTMLQNDEATDFNSQMFNVRTGIDFSFWENMHLRYGFTFNQSQMKIEQFTATSNIRNWKHDLSFTIPVHPFTFDLITEYNRNDLIDGNHKDFFLADVKVSYQSSRLSLSLILTNLLNNDTYSYIAINDLMSNLSINRIRGRELLLLLIYKM